MSESGIVVAGAGVIGLSLAYELAGRGARVTLLDRGEPGRACSWAGAGILTPASAAGARRPIDRLRALSLELLAAWSRQLRDETGIDNEYLPCGALEVALGEGELPALERTAADWRAQGVDIEEVPPAALAELEPALSREVVRAYLLPGGAQIRNPRHIRALIEACRRRGVDVHPDTEVHGFERSGGRVSAVITGSTGSAGSAGGTEGRRFAGEVFVAAAGAWSAALLAEAGVPLAVRPVRGQIALLRPPAPLLSHVVWRGPRYLVPRADGRVLAGATEEEAGFAAHPTAAGVDGLLHLAFDLVPALRDAPFERAWAGLRPGSADGLPYLGKAPGFENLYIAAGHYRAGFELSAGTARVMAQLILGEEPEVPLEAFRPDRG